jgi:hypothetical protein
MSVTVRPYVNGGWEVDIRVQLPDGSVIRERKKAAASSKRAAQKWAESRERVLLVHGKALTQKVIQGNQPRSRGEVLEAAGTSR